MALSATNFLASFDITDKTQEYDISAVLLAALMNDTGVLGILPIGTPARDTTHYWNEIALNASQVTVDGTGYNSASTAPVLASGHGARLRVGALLKNLAGGDVNPELVQVTNINSDTLTVVRAYGGSTAVTATFAANAVLDIIAMPLQEGSDIQSDSSVLPTVGQNYTQILERSITITRNQMKRPMAAVADILVQSIHDRTMELKRELERSVIHSRSASSNPAGNDATYRSMAGLFQLITQTTSIGATFAYAKFNALVKAVVDAGAADDISRLAFVAPTAVRQNISTFDASNRRLVESDRRAGYYVEQLVSDLGVVVDVVTSNYLGNTTPYRGLLLDCGRTSLLPFQDDSFKLMAAQDWVDGVKRRILGEWTLELRHAAFAHYAVTNMS
jgi:hypothetical protein